MNWKSFLITLYKLVEKYNGKWIKGLEEFNVLMVQYKDKENIIIIIYEIFTEMRNITNINEWKRLFRVMLDFAELKKSNDYTVLQVCTDKKAVAVRYPLICICRENTPIDVPNELGY